METLRKIWSRPWPRGPAAVIAAAVLTLAILLVHIPYFALTPGPAVDVTHLIAVRGVKTPTVKGKLMLTTVSVVTGDTSSSKSQPPGIRIIERLILLRDSSVAIVSRSDFVQPGQSEQDIEQQTTDQMRGSQVAAAASALQLLGYHVDIKYSGIRVLAVRSDAPASAVLHAGDKISDVDGRPVKHPVDLVRAIHKHPVGASVSLRVLRGASAFTVSVRTIGRPTNKRDPVIGVIIDSLPQVKLPLAVSIDAQGIGGPSAGLMFALGIVQTVGHTDLTKGRAIAGTGEIGLDGVVGPVGGIEQKMEGARRAHAQLFLSPLDELRDACRAAHGLKVFGVANLKEAVRALQGARLPADRQCS